MNTTNFPKRFEIEGLNPLELKVKIVTKGNVFIYDNVAAIPERFNNMSIVGPMACKHENVWCVRYESSEMYEMLSK